MLYKQYMLLHIVDPTRDKSLFEHQLTVKIDERM